jgi:flagellar biosynthesis/type III secretory pathway chaperone
MIDQRGVLLTELVSLQAKRRDALDAYNRTGDRACMRKVQETSQAIADKLRELEEMDGLTRAVDGLMGTGC